MDMQTPSRLDITAKPVFGDTGGRGATVSRHARAYLARLGGLCLYECQATQQTNA